MAPGTLYVMGLGISKEAITTIIILAFIVPGTGSFPLQIHRTP